jgi:hypothetical protein
MRNLYDKINKHIGELKIASKLIAKENAHCLNVFAFIGHGVVNEEGESLFLVNSKNDEGKFEIKAINVDQIAKDFAEIKNTMTIILFLAFRNKSSEHYEQ